MVITFLTDFGFQDEYVGTCHGVIKGIAPDVQIIDITHGIRPTRVLHGALVLANALPYMPAGVHLAVVDPGVGSQRRALALRGSGGRLFVGPDNGLLVPAIERLGGIDAVHELANPAYALPSVSRTFHGRDLFAPAAAHLALGLPLRELGPPVDPDALVRLDIPQAEVEPTHVRATVLDIDRFGNIQLGLRRQDLVEAGVSAGAQVELEHLGERYYAFLARTFADAPAGELILYEDAFGAIAVAITEGSAAELFAVSPGQQLEIHPRRV